MKIPVKNIYYLLCYAWNKLDEGQRVFVNTSDYKDAAELLIRVLINGCNHLFKKGLDRDYINVCEEYAGIKGKIDFSRTLNANLLEKGRAFCITDEFEYDILSNQLLKATLKKITKLRSLDSTLKDVVWQAYFRLAGVSDIEPRLSLFSSVRVHRNNSNYDFLLQVCKLILESIVIDETRGKHTFIDFTGNDTTMANLYESFIRNFYRKEQGEFVVDREYISWQAEPTGVHENNYLPRMQTDISLESSIRKIIIETKYYGSTLQTNFKSEKFHSSHLYQLYAYLRNVETKENKPINAQAEGILLYPTVDITLSESYIIGGHKVSVKTVDLSKDWKEIHETLLSIIN